MTKIAVFIATTDGPVRIERIAPEIAPVSEVFVGRGYKPLAAMSRDYDEFVARGRPVAKAFGPFDHPGFRLDVSGRIGDGQSWELAVFAAHGLAKNDRLAGPDEVPSAVAWLTGRVDVDLNVGKVDHIAEKFHAARALFEEWSNNGVPVIAYIPATGAVAPDGTEPEVVRVSKTDEVMQRLLQAPAEDGTTNKEARPPAARQEPVPVPRQRSWRLAAVIVVALGIVAVSGFAVAYPDAPGRLWRQAIELVSPQMARAVAERPPAPALSAGSAVPGESGSGFRLLARRAPEGRNCAEVHFARVDAVESPVGPPETRPNSVLPLGTMCGMVIELPRRKDLPVAALHLTVLERTYGVAVTAPVYQNLSGQPHRWVFDLPRRLREPAVFRLVAIQGSPGQRELVASLAKAADPLAAVAADTGRNLVTETFDIRIDP